MQQELQRRSCQDTEIDVLRTTTTKLATEVEALRIQTSRADQLEEEVNALKEEIARMRATSGESHLRTESAGKAT